MKKTLILLLLSFPVLVEAQTKNSKEVSFSINSIEPYLPAYNALYGTENNSNTLGTSNNNSYSLGILGKYFIKDNNAIRIRIVYTHKELNNIYHINDQNSGMTGYDNTSYEQQFFKIAPGYQWGISMNKISFFGGLEIPVTWISKFKYANDTKILVNDEISTFQSSEITMPDGFAFGVGFFMGSNLYITKYFGIGFELNSAYQHAEAGGDVSSNSINYQTGETTHVDSEGVKSKETKFTNINGSINLTFKF